MRVTNWAMGTLVPVLYNKKQPVPYLVVRAGCKMTVGWVHSRVLGVALVEAQLAHQGCLLVAKTLPVNHEPTMQGNHITGLISPRLTPEMGTPANGPSAWSEWLGKQRAGRGREATAGGREARGQKAGEAGGQTDHFAVDFGGAADAR